METDQLISMRIFGSKSNHLVTNSILVNKCIRLKYMLLISLYAKLSVNTRSMYLLKSNQYGLIRIMCIIQGFIFWMLSRMIMFNILLHMLQDDKT